MVKVTKAKTIQVVIIYSVCGLVLVLLYFLVARPISSYSDRMAMKLYNQTGKISEYENLIRSYPNPEKEIENIEKKIQELKGKAASREQIPRIIQQLASKTNELNINTISIRPREDIKYSEDKLIKGVSKVYIEIVLLTPYKIIGDYLKALTELPIILTVEDLSIEKQREIPVGPGSSKNNELLVTLLLSAYMVLEI
jgi:Tfp pilus assembly protein PilO